LTSADASLLAILTAMISHMMMLMQISIIVTTFVDISVTSLMIPAISINDK
jgi:hypothetical protein